MTTDAAGLPTQVIEIQRDDPSLDPPNLIAGYEAGSGLLRDAVAGLTREQFVARPVAGKWSTLEVVCHLCDSEQFFSDRMKRTLALDRPLLVAADAWLRAKSHAGTALMEALRRTDIKEHVITGGPIQFDGKGQNVNIRAAAVQNLKNKPTVVLPPEFAIARPVFPMPGWRSKARG